MLGWIPLEANVEIFNDYISELGIKKGIYFAEVYDKDFVESENEFGRLCAFILLKPWEQTSNNSAVLNSSDVIYLTQKVKNACGTIALLHVLLNFRQNLTIKKDSLMYQMIEDSKNLNQEQMSNYFAESKALKLVHQAMAKKKLGKEVSEDSEQSSEIEESNLHFTVFIHKDNIIYELDGRSGGVINYGRCDSKFIDGAFKIIEKIFSNHSDKLMDFSLISVHVE